MADNIFREALDMMETGSTEALTALLDKEPALVSARCSSVEPPYDGYFHGATLLHHTALNPWEAPAASTLPVAKALVAYGALVDAKTVAGPSQPRDITWTTLGLVATSAEARKRGFQLELMSFLVDHGARVDALNGGALMGALYYGELDAARWLVAHGARTDAVAAAGLGLEITVVEHTLVHYSQVELDDERADSAHVLGLCLIYAAKHGHVAVLRQLVRDLGADITHRPNFDHRATALHWAAKEARLEAVRFLLECGADHSAKDDTYDATPAQWNRHCAKNDDVLHLLESAV